MRMNSGPAPDPNALRRNRPSDAASWKNLPNRGLDEVPDWPETAPEPTMSELAMWARIWREQPQAHVWAEERMHDFVVVYVRTAIAAQSPDAVAAKLTAFRQQAESLLLTPAALRLARYRITGQEPEQTVDQDTGEPVAPVVSLVGPSVRDRMAAPSSQPPIEDDDEDDEEREPSEDD